MDKDILGIYSKNCLRCKHLVEFAEKEYTKCHHKNGNALCPAKEVHIAATGKVDRYVKLLNQAAKNKDAAKQARIYDFVSKQSEIFQERFFQKIQR